MDSVQEPGISGEVFLQALNDTSIQLTIETLHCFVSDVSDIS
jgi:hypothetical protein